MAGLRIRFDSFELDEADARLKRDGNVIALAPKAFAVLCELGRQPGALVTKDALLDAVWGHRHVSESVLKTTISELRSALSDDAKQPRYIETASRRGYRFIGSASSPGTVAAVTPARVTPTPSFVGREQALATLRRAWQRTQNSERQLVWISGEPGVGKTRLLETFAAELGPSLAVRGQCIEHFGSGEPYWPLLEALKELIQREPEHAPTLRQVAPTWVVQMPWLLGESERAALHREVAGAHQDRMVRELREFMDRYAAIKPHVFLLEDLHWSDPGTLRMMEHFARRPRQVRVLWVATFRSSHVNAPDHPMHEMYRDLRLNNLCDEIHLEPFSAPEVAAYLRTRAPETPFSEAFALRLQDHTGGLPLYVANVVDSLLAQSKEEPAKLDQWRDDAATGSLPVPDSLAGVIEKHIAALPLELQGLLEAASVCGAEFRTSIVAEMIKREPDWVIEQCDELARRQFWLRHVEVLEAGDTLDVRYAFLHAIYQHVFYRRRSLPQRVQMHRRAAAAMAATRAVTRTSAGELAHHYERGHQLLQATRYYGEAAANALTQHFAPLEAINLTTTALQLLERCPEDDERRALELKITHVRGTASAQQLGIASLEAIAAFERVRDLCEMLPEAPERMMLLNGVGLTSFVRGDYAGAIVIGERATRLYNKYADPVIGVYAHLLNGVIATMQGKHEQACEVLQAGAKACELAGDRIPQASFIVDPTVSLHAYCALAFVHSGKVDRGREEIEIGRRAAIRLGQPIARMLILWFAGLVEIRCSADAQRVRAIADELQHLVEETALLQLGGPAKMLRGWARARLGSPMEGYRSIREGYEIHARLGRFSGNTETLGHAAEALLLGGEVAQAESQLAEALELATRIGERFDLVNLLLLQARISAAKGNPAAARTSIDAALAEARSQHSPYFESKALAALTPTES